MQQSATLSGSMLLAPDQLGLVADLYELTMGAAYWSAGLGDRTATFDLFFRSLPARRSYMIAAGLEQAIEYLLNLRVSADDIRYLRTLAAFAHVPDGWFSALRDLRFTGDVWAMAEGTIAFPEEPMVRVTAPVLEAQLVETYLIASCAFQTSVATKASRLVHAARGRSVVDFGARRAHGPQAGMLAARASYIGGCSGTSLVEAARRLDIPAVGTMAHSWVMAFEDEHEAFEKFASVFPDATTLLIDTYNTVEGARVATRTKPRPGAVRLDSGDLDSLARQVRQVLDDAGWHDVKIFASGDLNEYKIDALVAAGAPIDAFGVGTELTTVADAPSLGCVYKLAEFDDGEPGRIKLSSGKRTYPGLKQVFRQVGSDGTLAGDVIGLADETLHGTRLLEPVIVAGKLVRPLPALSETREHCAKQLETLPESMRLLDASVPPPVRVSERLEQAYARLADRIMRRRTPPGPPRVGASNRDRGRSTDD